MSNVSASFSVIASRRRGNLGGGVFLEIASGLMPLAMTRGCVLYNDKKGGNVPLIIWTSTIACHKEGRVIY